MNRLLVAGLIVVFAVGVGSALLRGSGGVAYARADDPWQGVTSDGQQLSYRLEPALANSLIVDLPSAPGVCQANYSGTPRELVPPNEQRYGLSILFVGAAQISTIGASRFTEASPFDRGKIDANPTPELVILGAGCKARNVTWAAVDVRQATNLIVGATSLFEGTTDKGGRVSFSTSDTGRNLAFSLELPAGCPAVSRSGPTDSFISDTGGMVVGVGTTGLVRAWGIRDALYGVYATPSPPPPGCPVGVGTFVATRRVATPTPTTTPPGSSAVVGAAPGAGSFGLLVAGMATTPAALAAELASKGCAVSTLAIVRSGSWLIYVNGAPPVINAPFPSNVDATTPFFVRCN